MQPLDWTAELPRSKIENSALYWHFGVYTFTYVCEIRSVAMLNPII